jgi:hypothetical protein
VPLLTRLRSFWRIFSGRPIHCPTCHQKGYDSAGSSRAVFEQRGRWGAHPVRKCLTCGSGLLIKGHRFEAIAADRWAAMERYYEAETALEDRETAAEGPTAGPLRWRRGRDRTG